MLHLEAICPSQLEQLVLLPNHYTVRRRLAEAPALDESLSQPVIRPLELIDLPGSWSTAA